ncbi:OsmC family protein [Massilia sp. TS11]|uniref:OsmC family protein n=1 Tax=Massilia sp. TS11 TaxID=2908003 RepID=UPI001EDC4F11|nr:OsmC family protein [Massilia sp. TS11]MCG2586777.1 OsmC family protein [Massilia sp. TS11]
MIDKVISVVMEQQQDYQIRINFGADVPSLLADEPAPLGQGSGPSPMHLLCSAVGTCLTDSLLFALRKFKQQPEPLGCTVEADVGRNEAGRLRVLAMRAHLRLGVPAEQLAHLDRVLEQFEQFCTVTQSVGQGIPVTVSVSDAMGKLLK